MEWLIIVGSKVNLLEEGMTRCPAVSTEGGLAMPKKPSSKSRGAGSRPGSPGKQRTRLAADVLPRRRLEQALPLAQALHDTHAGKATAWADLCSTLRIGSKTNNTKYMFWSAEAYGIIIKQEGRAVFTLSETGRKIVAPEYDGEDREAIRKAVLIPTILSKFYSDYDGHPVPKSEHLPNVLERKYGVPRARIEEAMEIIIENARYAGILEEGPDGERSVNLSGVAAAESAERVAEAEELPEPAAEERLPEKPARAVDWSKICFFITPVGEENTDVRRHADMMLKHLLNPVAKEFGLEVVRADKIERSGLITQQIFDHLTKARLCVADLSFNNPNAFYELGVRHVCKLPTIQLVRRGDKIPFDVSQGRTIIVDTGDVYTITDRLESARRELTEHMKHILSGGKQYATDDNPVHVYLPTLKITLPK